MPSKMNYECWLVMVKGKEEGNSSQVLLGGKKKKVPIFKNQEEMATRKGRIIRHASVVIKRGKRYTGEIKGKQD